MNFLSPHLIYNSITITDTKGKSVSSSFPKGQDKSTYKYQLEALAQAVLTKNPKILFTDSQDAILNMKVIDDIKEIKVTFC